MDWPAISESVEGFYNTISAISIEGWTGFMALVILCAAIVSVVQLRRFSKSSTAAAYMEIFQFLQQEHIRKARRALIKTAENKRFKDWSEEEKKQAEPACASYDVVGAMVRKRFIKKFFVVDKWRSSIIECWEAAEPMVKEYREGREDDDFWNDFERIYRMARNRRKSAKSKFHAH